MSATRVQGSPSRRLEHREACYELRRSARLLAEQKLTLPDWERSVNRILDARYRGEPTGQPAPEPTKAAQASTHRTSTPPDSRRLAGS